MRGVCRASRLGLLLGLLRRSAEAHAVLECQRQWGSPRRVLFIAGFNDPDAWSLFVGAVAPAGTAATLRGIAQFLREAGKREVRLGL